MPNYSPKSDASTYSASHTIPEAQAAGGLAAVLSGSDDAKRLLLLLSFLAAEEIPVDLLVRGATPRRRWDIQGEIEGVDALRAGLDPELGSFLSDTLRLSNAFFELDLLSAVSKNSGQTYTLNEAVAGRIHESLPPEHRSFWRCQALVVAYRAIPWKYIEPA
jgi:hypothetical protein